MDNHEVCNLEEVQRLTFENTSMKNQIQKLNQTVAQCLERLAKEQRSQTLLQQRIAQLEKKLHTATFQSGSALEFQQVQSIGVDVSLCTVVLSHTVLRKVDYLVATFKEAIRYIISVITRYQTINLWYHCTSSELPVQFVHWSHFALLQFLTCEITLLHSMLSFRTHLLGHWIHSRKLWTS